eukprot:CAMPEP_0172758774 /NCGR_PEP_ID=MMETSP1074-20121228/166413_1 /TAXON_ID=2916 /ORGANISM="Ceratium fusus, Strain PA161109" /LENGTH=61 /DNA_ID=CAMNT_0013592423 /DNA_START=139 /DNA_END=321 /DNA_ORIENTATION=-
MGPSAQNLASQALSDMARPEWLADSAAIAAVVPADFSRGSSTRRSTTSHLASSTSPDAAAK